MPHICGTVSPTDALYWCRPAVPYPHPPHPYPPRRSLQAPRGILVGNAVPELKQWARQQQHVYVATQPVAAGVMEGLQRWGFLDTPLAN